jgi:hypothetical protein
MFALAAAVVALLAILDVGHAEWMWWWLLLIALHFAFGWGLPFVGGPPPWDRTPRRR